MKAAMWRLETRLRRELRERGVLFWIALFASSLLVFAIVAIALSD